LDPDVDRLGDLDLALTAVRHESDGERLVQLYWPNRELLMMLKNRSPAIKITREDVSQLTSRFAIVYAVADDPDAIQPPPNAMVDA
jgi:hypothetical protein